jgi:hypothetical protein
MDVVKICQDDFHKFYVDMVLAFNDDLFHGFHGLVTTNHEEMNMKWFVHLITKIDHLVFEFNGKHIWVKHKCVEISAITWVTHDIHYTIVNGVKQ